MLCTFRSNYKRSYEEVRDNGISECSYMIGFNLSPMNIYAKIPILALSNTSMQI